MTLFGYVITGHFMIRAVAVAVLVAIAVTVLWRAKGKIRKVEGDTNTS